MTSAELRQALAVLPEGAALTLTVRELREALEDAPAVPAEDTNPDRLDTEAAARRLGVKPKTVANWCAAGRFSGAMKTGAARGKWTIPVDAVEAWLNGQQRGTVSG